MSEWPSLDKFSKIMREQLENNSHKGYDRQDGGDWVKGTTVEKFIGHIEEELIKVRRLRDNRDSLSKYNYPSVDALRDDITADIIKKCANIANYAMMCSNVAEKKDNVKLKENNYMENDEIPF